MSTIVYTMGKTKSSFFTISNGVRQGGILSPKLFSVHMDDLSNMLIRSGVGCYIDNICVNHAFYAEDLCLMAPCAITLQDRIIKHLSHLQYHCRFKL